MNYTTGQGSETPAGGGGGSVAVVPIAAGASAGGLALLALLAALLFVRRRRKARLDSQVEVAKTARTSADAPPEESDDAAKADEKGGKSGSATPLPQPAKAVAVVPNPMAAVLPTTPSASSAGGGDGALAARVEHSIRDLASGRSRTVRVSLEPMAIGVPTGKAAKVEGPNSTPREGPWWEGQAGNKQKKAEAEGSSSSSKAGGESVDSAASTPREAGSGGGGGGGDAKRAMAEKADALAIYASSAGPGALLWDRKSLSIARAIAASNTPGHSSGGAKKTAAKITKK